MKLLVTGATGLVGAHLAGAARLQGHRVIATGMINNSLEQLRRRSLEGSGISVLAGRGVRTQSGRGLRWCHPLGRGSARSGCSR